MGFGGKAVEHLGLLCKGTVRLERGFRRIGLEPASELGVGILQDLSDVGLASPRPIVDVGVHCGYLLGDLLRAVFRCLFRVLFELNLERP